LIAWRRRRDTLVKRVLETTRALEGQDFRLIVYEDTISGAEHLALVKGEIRADTPVLVRMHAFHLLQDMLSAPSSLHKALAALNAEKNGVIVILRDPRKKLLSETLGDAPVSGNLRDYGIGAQILADLGVHQMILLTNTPKAIIGLEGYDLEVAGYREL